MKISEYLKGLKVLYSVNMKQNVITCRFWTPRVINWKPCIHGAYDIAPYDKYVIKFQDVVAGVLSRVIKIGDDPKGFGIYLKLQSIDYPDLIAYKAHLKYGSICVKVGDVIDSKQIVAIMGNTGNCVSRWGGDGTHLHEEFRIESIRGNYEKVDMAYYYKDWDFNGAYRV